MRVDLPKCSRKESMSACGTFGRGEGRAAVEAILVVYLTSRDTFAKKAKSYKTDVV
jgi:hypothetical protein